MSAFESRKVLIGLFLVSCCNIVSIDCVVAENFREDFASMDLYEIGFGVLGKIEFVSKKEETIGLAPGVVTVVTEEEIRHFGARNLREILDRLPNMQVLGRPLFPHGKSSIRGVNNLQHPDGAVLLLMDGIPIRDTTTGGFNSDLYLTFPIESIQQIEVIRGPGSVLYGTNAFAGAINIRTKPALSQPQTSISTSYGSFDFRKLALSTNFEQGDFRFSGTFNGIDTQGDEFSDLSLNASDPGDFRTGYDGYGGVFTMGFKKLTISGIFTSVDLEVLDNAPLSFPLVESNVERQLVNLKYIWEDLKIGTVTMSYTPSRTSHDSPNGERIRSMGHFVDFNSVGDLADNLDYLIGFTHETTELKTSNGTEDHSYWNEVYAQLGYQPKAWLKLVGGLQMNKPENIQEEFSPRLGLLLDFGKGLGAKLLYGKAFRSATILDNRVNSRPRITVPELEPETINTFDAQLHFSKPGFETSLTYYHSEHEDLHQFFGGPPGVPPVIRNLGEIDYDGVEWEGKFRFTKNVFLIGNVSYQTNEDGDGVEDSTIVPNWMAKGGISYDSPIGFTVSIFNSFFDDATAIEEINPNLTTVNEDADGYNLLSVNLIANLGKILSEPILERIEVALYGDNLLDENIFFPANSRGLNLPIQNGRSVYGTLKFEF